MNRFANAALLGLATTLSLFAQNPQLSIGTVSGTPGQTVTLNVTLASLGQSVSGLGFTLNYDTSNLAQAVTTASITNGSPNITVTSSTSIVPGESVAGAGIPAGTTVSTVSGNSVTLSASATSTNASANLTFASLTVALSSAVVSAGNSAGSPFGLTQSRNSNGLAIVIVNLGSSSANPILLPDGDILDITIRIPASAAPATYPITFSNASWTDPAGDNTATNDTPTTVNGSVTVAAFTQTISFGTLSNVTFGAAPFTVSASASSGLPVSFTSSTNGVCTTGGTNGSTVTIVGGGTCSIIASQSGNTSYAPAPSITQMFTVNPGPQTISFAQIPAQTFNGTSFPVIASATATSGLAVSFTSNSAGVCTTGGTNGSTLTVVGLGTCSLTLSQGGNATYAPALNVAESFAVTMASQTITFNAPAAVTFGVAPFTLIATASSNLPVSFTSTTPAVCTTGGTNGATATIVSGGTCTIIASQGGNADYTAAANVTQSFTVNPEAQTITFNAPGAVTFGVAPFNLSATTTSNLPVTFTASNSAGVCTTGGANGATVTIVGGGTCTIIASQAGNASYTTASNVTQSFTVNPGPQTITFPAPGAVTFGVAPFMLNATAGSNLAVSFASSTPAVCTTGGTNGATVTIVGGGTCTIVASQGGNVTYAVAPNVTQNFTVNAASQTITFGTLSSVGYGGPPLILTATASSNLPVSFASSTLPVCTTSGTNGATLTILEAGTCTIVASQAGNANYALAPSVTQSFTVTGEAQTITFGAPPAVTFGILPFAVSATSTSNLAVSFASTTPAVCTTGGANGATVTIIGGGTCTIVASQAGNATFAAAPNVTQSFTVNPAAQTITFGAPAAVTFGAAPFALSATASSGLAVSFASTTPSVCTTGGANGATVTIIGGGTCTIVANQAGNANYSAATTVTQSFTVNPATQTITFNALNNVGYGSAPFAVSGTSSSNLVVTFAASNSAGVCTTGGTNGATVTIVGLGTCSIIASQAGNANYSVATQVTRSFTVTQGSQTIAFNAPGSVALGTPPFTLSATATSTLTVSFASSTNSVCTAGGANGATVTILTVGTCSIVASQAGNVDYLAAPSVTQNISVTTVSISGPVSLPNGLVTISYFATINAVGGTGIYTWSATGLPPGLTINPNTGAITGIPTTLVGSPFSAQVTVTDSYHNTARMTYLIVILPAPPIPSNLALAGPFVLPTGNVNVAYSTTISATGGVPPYTYSATNLPAGLTINSSSGAITGTPTAATSGVVNVTVTVTDSNSIAVTGGYNLTISGGLTVTAPAALPAGAVGQPYPSTALTAGGGVAPYTWSATGLPNGLSISSAGFISGTPATSTGSPFTVTVTVTDSNGNKATRSFTLTVNSQLSISGPASLPVATVNVAYPGATVTATGGVAPYSWSATGLPAGLTIGSTTGAITGTTTASVGSPFSVQVTVTDSNSSTASMTYTLTVNQSPSTLPQIGGVSNAAGGQAIVAAYTWVSIYGSNFTSPNFTDTWSNTIVNGKLPTVLDGVSVMVGGQAAYMYYLSATQIDVLLPNLGVGSMQLTVTTPAGVSAAATINSQTYSPAFFSWPNNQPVATHADFSYAVAPGTFASITTIPAKPGETIILWGDGFGATNPIEPFGVAIPTSTVYTTAVPVTATINNIPATVSSAALASGSAGLYQIAITVPASLANGSYAVIASINGVSTPTLNLTVHN